MEGRKGGEGEGKKKTRNVKRKRKSMCVGSREPGELENDEGW